MRQRLRNAEFIARKLSADVHLHRRREGSLAVAVAATELPLRTDVMIQPNHPEILTEGRAHRGIKTKCIAAIRGHCRATAGLIARGLQGPDGFDGRVQAQVPRVARSWCRSCPAVRGLVGHTIDRNRPWVQVEGVELNNGWVGDRVRLTSGITDGHGKLQNTGFHQI